MRVVELFHFTGGLDDRTVVPVSEFESIKVEEEVFQSPAFKENLSKLQAVCGVIQSSHCSCTSKRPSMAS